MTRPGLPRTASLERVRVWYDHEQDDRRNGEPVSPWVALAAGVACAWLGGELFVRGTVGIARWARVCPGIIGATVAAFATSAPELSVSINAAVAGNPEMGLGDALGSNIVNVALVLALVLLISAIRSPRANIKRDFPVAILVPVVTVVLVLDGVLSRLDGVLMLSIFCAWLVATILGARKERSPQERGLLQSRKWLPLLLSAVGLGVLFSAGLLIVSGGRGIGAVLGIDGFIIGATIVAVGTSTPELAASVVAKLRGYDEIGLGTILGSNIFNGLLIVAVAALIRPIHVEWREVGFALAFGLAALLLAYPTRGGAITRRRGVLLLLLYVGYLVTVIQTRAL